jgi:hypothetical protein
VKLSDDQIGGLKKALREADRVLELCRPLVDQATVRAIKSGRESITAALPRFNLPPARAAAVARKTIDEVNQLLRKCQQAVPFPDLKKDIRDARIAVCSASEHFTPRPATARAVEATLA